jgi:membrane fusion protein (multidrug efflux system)
MFFSRAFPRFASLNLSPARAALATVAALAVAACGEAGPGAGGAGQMPPPQVGVVTVQTSGVTLTAELPGRLESVRTAQIRARVTGVIKRRLFTEGSLVKAGQSLFEIDDSAYRATLDSAVAGQSRAEAALSQANATLERNRPLVEARAISQQEWVATQVAQQQAAADVAAAKAAVAQARLNVEYATVLSPISGRIGRATVSEGALVSATEATLLATVQQVDKLYVNFTQSAAEALRLKRAVEAGKYQASGSSVVRVLLDDGSEYPESGKLLFSDLTVDPTSGQVSLRAELPNPKGDLLPGLFVKVRVDQVRSDSAILLPQQAVTRGVAGDTVLVVGADQQVSPRPVQLGGARGSQWVVLGGLKAGEQVVVDGFQKIRPKAPVSPVPWVPAPVAPAPASASSAPDSPVSAAAPAPAASR